MAVDAPHVDLRYFTTAPRMLMEENLEKPLEEGHNEATASEVVLKVAGLLWIARSKHRAEMHSGSQSFFEMNMPRLVQLWRIRSGGEPLKPENLSPIQPRRNTDVEGIPEVTPPYADPAEHEEALRTAVEFVNECASLDRMIHLFRHSKSNFVFEVFLEVMRECPGQLFFLVWDSIVHLTTTNLMSYGDIMEDNYENWITMEMMNELESDCTYEIRTREEVRSKAKRAVVSALYESLMAEEDACIRRTVCVVMVQLSLMVSDYIEVYYPDYDFHSYFGIYNAMECADVRSVAIQLARNVGPLLFGLDADYGDDGLIPDSNAFKVHCLFTYLTTGYSRMWTPRITPETLQIHMDNSICLPNCPCRKVDEAEPACAGE